MNRSFAPPVTYQHKLPDLEQIQAVPSLKKADHFVVVYDRRLEKSAAFRLWRDSFQHHYSVTAGEDLKSLQFFQVHMEKILTLVNGASPPRTCLVAVGGGSVGDFTGFAASVLKRGVSLVHIPTTWLAAIDSAHGGKTALNLGSFKNQIGTFWPADAVFVISHLLGDIDDKQLDPAFGELIKIALLAGEPFYSHFIRTTKKTVPSVWEILPAAVEAKKEIVLLDPYEQTGTRQILNLGHTFGHLLEAYHQWPHGIAVAHGLKFAIDWSCGRGHLSEFAHKKMMKELEPLWPEALGKGRKPVPKKVVMKQLAQDKKAESEGAVQFIFIKGVGQPIREKVGILELVDEATQQGWVR